jgi:hypothetical protein
MLPPHAVDLLPFWPHPVPTYLITPRCSGVSDNPWASNEETYAASGPFIQRALPVLALHLSGAYHVPRRATEKMMGCSSVVARLAATQTYRSMLSAIHEQFPHFDASAFNHLDPTLATPYAPARLPAAFNRLSVNSSFYVHPVCPNQECHYVLYEYTCYDLVF